MANDGNSFDNTLVEVAKDVDPSDNSPAEDLHTERQKEIDDWYDFRSDEINVGAIAGEDEEEEECPKKKKKGDGIRDVIVALRKNQPQVTTGLINNWFDEVIELPDPPHHLATVRPGGLELDNNNIVSSLAPEHEHEAGVPKLNTSLKRKFNADSTPSPVPSESPSKRSHKQLLLLPPGATVHNRFHRVFIPTYERWVGTLENPWFIPDDVAVKTMQSI
ncbi:hypothetical protein EI94DRAFT_1818204 [Lactarius quietus]|nr:hypothetical protein EI94DRAFT_1818204 [Lactarius quietus]